MGYTQDWKQSKQQVYKHQLINIQNDRNGSRLGRSHHNDKRTTSDIDAPPPFEATECGNMGYNSMQIGPNCYYWVNGSFTMEQAREQCVMKGGILATLHEKADYDMLKGVVHDKYEFSDANNQLAVFWLDQMFDYDNRVLTCCDGTQKDEKDASLQGMWYRGQPCWTKDTPNMVLVFRGQTVLLEKPYMEEYQGLFTIKTGSTWNALCMTNK